MHLRLLTHPEMLGHDPGEAYAESPGRLATILAEIAAATDLQVESCDRLASREELQLAHDDAYVRAVLAMTTGGALDEETLLSPGSVVAAQRAAGIALAAVAQLCTQRSGAVFALVRPPGHHAMADAAMGYCVFNNAALAALAALAAGRRRVAVVDLDAHHGNGTQAILGDRADVWIVDVHQARLFPQDAGDEAECGRGAGTGQTYNIPVPAEATDSDYLHLLDAFVIPLLDTVDPEFVVISAGFDAHWTDPQAQLCVTTDGFAAMAARLARWASSPARPMLWLLEGGYALRPLARNVVACAQAIRQDAAPSVAVGSPSSAVGEQVARLVARANLRGAKSA